MPNPGERNARPDGVAGGLNRSRNPLLVAPSECTDVENLLFDEASAQEAGGMRRVATERPRLGAPRCAPARPRASIAEVTRWRDGYLWAPCREDLRGAQPQAIEAHVCLEHPLWAPEGRFGTAPVLHFPPTGRYTDTAGQVRKGGEHHFFPIVASGACAIEKPGWALGVGVALPQGLYGSAGVERVSPMFVWWDETQQRTRVAASDAPLQWGKAYHVAVVLSGSPSFYVDGSIANTVAGFGLSSLPLNSSLTSAARPFYFGRYWTREPGLKYDATQYDRKHAYMGRCGIVPAAVGANTVRFSGSQLAFAAATANSYVGYRVRVVSKTPADDAEVGKVYWITAVANQTTDTGGASITFTLNAAHAITTSHTLDVVPACEPMPVAATIQEVRLWNTAPSSSTIRRNASRRILDDWRADRLDRKFLNDLADEAPQKSLDCYWPMNEDGGNVCRDLVGGAHAVFAPSVLADAGDGRREIRLDGEQTSVQVDLRDDPNFVRNWAYNLGREIAGTYEWQTCFRLNFMVPGTSEFTNAGNRQDHLYRTVAAIGGPGVAAALEVRLTNFGANGLHLYVATPDGQYIPIPYTLTPGRWYDAVVGVEAVATNAADPQEHYAYFQFRDSTAAAGGVLSGAVSAAFTLKRGAIDTAKTYLVAFGASIEGTATQGAQRNNPCALLLRGAGVGFFQAHFPTTGAPSMTDATQLSPGVRFGTPNDDDFAVPVLGADAGTTLTAGSPRITVDSGLSLPAGLRRAVVTTASVLTTRKRAGEADAETPDGFVVRNATSTSCDAQRAHDQASVRGAALRLLPWVAYTDFATADPPYDVDLNAGRDSGSRWALTRAVLPNRAPTLLEMSVATDPAYEFVSPLRVAPEWGLGLVDPLYCPVRAGKEFRAKDGRLFRAAVAGGSLFEFDDRRQIGGPYLPTDYSYRVRRAARWRSERFRVECVRSDAVTRMNAPDRVEGVEVPLNTFAGSPTQIGFVAMVRLDDLYGRQTVAFAGWTVLTGATPKVYCAPWLRLDEGRLVIEARLPSGSIIFRTDAAAPLRAGAWHEILGTLVADGGGALIGAGISVDGTPLAGTTTSAGTPTRAEAQTSSRTWWGCAMLGDVSACDPLRGSLGALAALTDAAGWSGSVDYTPAVIEAGYHGAEYLLALQTIDEHYVPVTTANYGDIVAVLHAKPLPLGHGAGFDPDVVPSLDAMNGVLYLSTFKTRPWRFDGDYFTPSGIAPPAARLSTAAVSRVSARVKDAAADLPLLVGRANRCDLNAAAPHLRTFAGSTPNPAQGDIGALVYVPSDPDMGAAGDDPPGYIGVVGGVQSTGYTLTPSPFAEQQVAGVGELAWTLFRRGIVIGLTPSTISFMAAIQQLVSTTPWGAGRLLCDGKDDVSAPVDETLAEGPTNLGAAQFRGATRLVSAAWQPSAGAPARGMVFSFKCYLRADTLPGDGEEQVIHERALDGDTGSWRLLLFSGGRLRFEFFDTLLGAKRWIQTTGRVVTAGQWHYLHFRYRFKQAGGWFFDTVGGWEPDLRWTRRGGTIDAAVNNFRDMLLIYACEGLHKKDLDGYYAHQNTSANYYGDVDDAPVCPLLSLPGCEASVGGATAAGAVGAYNHSQHLLNVGLLKSAPYITPQKGDSLFPAAGVNAASPQNGIELTLLVNTIQAMFVGGVPVVGADAACQFQLPANFVLPRSCSMNRDDAWNREADAGTIEAATQIQRKSSGTLRQSYWNNIHPAYPATNVGATPNLGSPAVAGGGQVYGRFTLWAVLVRIWTKTAAGAGPVGSVGDFPDGASGGIPRVLALVHLNDNDLGTNSRGGTAAHKIFITDDPLYGGDGLGSLKIGGTPVEVNSKWHATIELPNGSNQASTSSNRNSCPALLEHGTNPVGVNDAPDQSLAPVRFGGTASQNDPGTVRSGFYGSMDDAGFLLSALNASAANVYTTDCLPPDAFFTGPKDTRIQSLPRLCFVYNANILDVASGTAAAVASACYRFDEQSGLYFAKETASSEAGAPPLVFERQGAQLALAGAHKFRVTYYDPAQDVESNPGPEFTVQLDGSGDHLDAAASFSLDGLPVAGDRRPSLYRRVYKTLADGADFLLFAEVGDNATTAFVPIVSTARLVTERLLSFDNGRPPYCRAMLAGEEAFAYGGLDDAPDVVAISKAFKPELVPGTAIVTCESGRGGPVLALGLLRGLFVAAKRHALFVITPSDPPRVERVGGMDGVLGQGGFAEFDGVLLGLSAGGIVAYNGNQAATLVSARIRTLYLRDSEPTLLPRGSAAAWLDRTVWCASFPALGDDEARWVLTAEARRDDALNRVYAFSKLRPGVGPAGLVSADGDRGGVSGLLLFSSLGLALEADLGDAVGADCATAAIGSMASPSRFEGLVSMGSVLLLPDGAWDGAPLLLLQELDVNGAVAVVGQGVRLSVIHRTEIVATDRSVVSPGAYGVHVRDQFPAFAGTAVAIVGGRTWSFSSPRIAFEPEATKAAQFLDFEFLPLVGGAAFLTLYHGQDDAVAGYYRVPLDSGRYTVGVANIRSRFFRFKLEGYGHHRGFELFGWGVRATPTYAKRELAP